MGGKVERRIFRFGVFEADTASGELRKHGVRIKLHSQPFQVLLMLLERPSDVVTREEMRQRLWGDDTFVDFNHSLNSAINKIREALADSASQPRYVETISGKGYRFIAPVSSASPPGQASPASAPGGRLATTPGPGESPAAAVLTTSDDLPAAPKTLVRTLLLLIQALYCTFYVSALANLSEIDEIFFEARLPSGILITGLILTAALLIPVRLFLFSAVAFDYRRLPSRFTRMFPVLLPFDLLWSVSPFLLVHHIPVGLALGMTTALVYLPFAQRSLVLMYGGEP